MGHKSSRLQQLVKVLEEFGEVEQRELLRSSRIPRPTLMRLLRLLESKSLIERRRQGISVKIIWRGGNLDPSLLEFPKPPRVRLNPLPEIVKRIFREEDEYLAVGWLGLIYPWMPFLVTYPIAEFLVPPQVLERLKKNGLTVEVDEMKYEVRLYTAPESFLKEVRIIDGVRFSKDPFRAWLLARSIARGGAEELAELTLATYSPVAYTPIAQAIGAKLLSLVTGKEPEINIKLDHPVVLRYGDVDADVDWLNSLWKKGIFLYLRKWHAGLATRKLIATIGWKYIVNRMNERYGMECNDELRVKAEAGAG